MSEFKVDPKDTLDAALKEDFERVLVIGVTKGDVFFAAGSGSTEKNLDLIEEFQRRLEEDDWDDSEEEAA
jgi:coenzyme F420-reducing hydrogenase delta subunit